MSLANRLGTLLAHRGGSMTIELAAVAPVLVLMSIGTFEVSSMVSRQQELQSAASEGETIALAAAASAQSTPLATIEDIIEESMGLQGDQVQITRFYRCNADAVLVTSEASCNTDDVVTSYMKLELTDRYEPVWTQFGIGSAFDYNVERMVQL
jgi:Flp pilus assembly protein TadG